MITINAPAKINLTLEVLDKRPDGFHEIRSILQTISLGDRLSFRTGEKLEFKSDSPGWAGEKSLVSRAAHLLQEAAGCTTGANITVAKHIPLVSGLGGDSSDAAATLKGLHRLWKLALPETRLLELASGLGSDVPFFIGGGTALAAGRGEIVTPLPSFPRMWIVLVVPDIPRVQDKTRQLYEKLKPNHYTDGSITRQAAAKLKESQEFPPDLLYNIFEQIAFDFFPGLGSYRERMLESGAPHVHLAGSGPALFVLLKESLRAEALCRCLKQRKMATFLAETLPPERKFKL